MQPLSLLNTYVQDNITADDAFFTSNSEPCLQYFHQIGNYAYGTPGQCQQIVPWEQGYALFTLGWAENTGLFSGQHNFYQWGATGLTDIADGSTAWCKYLPAFYGAGITGTSTWAAAFTQTTTASGTFGGGTFPANDTWGQPLTPASCLPAKLWGVNSSGDYPVIVRGAIDLAVKNGITSATAAQTSLDSLMPALMGWNGSNYGYAGSGISCCSSVPGAKWSVNGTP